MGNKGEKLWIIYSVIFRPIPKSRLSLHSCRPSPLFTLPKARASCFVWRIGRDWYCRWDFQGQRKSPTEAFWVGSGGSHSLSQTAQAFGSPDSTFSLLLPPRRDWEMPDYASNIANTTDWWMELFWGSPEYSPIHEWNIYWENPLGNRSIRTQVI